MQLRSNFSFILSGSRMVVEPLGGVGPYTYSLLPGGDGGTFNSSGFYTAPSKIVNGFQVIRVTDSQNKRADLRINILNHLQIICKIISRFLQLEDDQIYIYNQKITVPKDNRLYIATMLGNTKVFSSNRKMLGDQEVLTSNNSASITINIMSKTLEALERKEEVVAALRGQFSQQVQNAYSFKIGEIPTSFNDISNIEGSAIPYRFNISFNMQYSVKITKDVNYYDEFSDIELETNQ